MSDLPNQKEENLNPTGIPLSSLPSNMIFSYRTRKGHMPNNPNKPNQDSLFLFPEF